MTTAHPRQSAQYRNALKTKEDQGLPPSGADTMRRTFLAGEEESG